MANSIKLFIWLLLTIFVIDIGCELVTMADTLLNVLGLTIMFLFILLTIKTKCLTSLKNKENEKN